MDQMIIALFLEMDVDNSTIDEVNELLKKTTLKSYKGSTPLL